MNCQLRGDYRTGCPEGEGFMPEVSSTSDKDNGGVFVLVEPSWTTFVFGINSSGHSNSTGQFIGQTVRRGNVRCSLCYRGVVDIRIAYSYLLYFSDQLSCIKFLNPSYGLKVIEFQSLNQF